ncbi:AraC family transcriptional regulator [Cupriavidus taiwanensis]|uniref:Transcriptional Regulator, AraC n=1 Tax=Cupriavidus taiwanensis TaxID=164546 RepID=A0A7Z7NNQ9_9BURK|nr:AraC family transcriptional regulator [Cupriavidus taiwanensis]SOZ09884.1 Putative Transcriptional Regulator, AraC [Cupriavidus taiwanensis]SOZ11999.1 Putative Transcriptional Regulator, AraC [Cupriavidus taiwanensis]SOZ43357.1 Putative Transcriptional Regulator, AraC [Cupriavidus taiwanensis]SPC22600.1 Putative Transcriptional Regulator, AraC [Cupriavidus taiwanensis]SPD54110.1 putative Transcriptional Regulator, AraC [Cupriavidus taiwanensis]
MQTAVMPSPRPPMPGKPHMSGHALPPAGLRGEGGGPAALGPVRASGATVEAGTPAPARHTIAIQHVTHILQGGRRLGHDIEALLRRADISPALLASPSARVTQGQYAALIRTLRRVMRDELWGLLDRPVTPGVFAQVCRSLVDCATLEDAIRTGLRLYRQHIDAFAPRLHVAADGKTAAVVLHPRAPASACRSFAESTFVFHAYAVVSWLVAGQIPLTRVELSAAASPGRTDTERVFKTAVSYGQPVTALHFDAASLRLPVMQDAASLRDFLHETPRNLLIRYRDNSCLAERIRQHLRSHLDGELPSLEQMAQRLRLTPQTLRRRLRDEGRGYQSIKDNLRRDVAIGMMERPGMTLQDVALRLGFSEPSTFHRAFKKWTGVAPGEYRMRGMRAEGVPAA